MGREAACAFARWIAVEEVGLEAAKLIAVADVHEPTLNWFKRVDTVTQLTTNYEEILTNPEVDAVYVALPHALHESVYGAVIDSGKDLLGEKPFGIDLASCERLVTKIEASNYFVRCSSEFPFYPVAHAAFNYLAQNNIGIPIEGKSFFWHSSDVNPNKTINWKRQVKTCGEIGVMGDLGMHVCHLPFRLSITPIKVYAQLQKIFAERPDQDGAMVPCDTWDNARLITECVVNNSNFESHNSFPFLFETKRIAPSETNTWGFELIGTKGGVRITTKYPKTFMTLEVFGNDQVWRQIDLGSESEFQTITGAIFETGFSDALLQMWVAFTLERSGKLGSRFGCATPEEALMSHRLFDAALQSHKTGRAIDL